MVTDFVGIVPESHPKAETTVERYMSTDVVTTTDLASYLSRVRSPSPT